MERLQITMKQLLTAIFWLAVGFACAANIVFVVRRGGIADQWEGIALLAEIIVGGTALGAAVGTLARRQFSFTILGAVGAFALVAAARYFR